MKKQILALMTIMPLLFIITLFSVGKVAEVYVDIAVSGIHITTQNDGGFIDIDMADYNDDIYLKAQVEPHYSTNKNYYFKVSGVGNAAAADISVDDDGRLIVRGDGKAKVTAVSADRGFTDSVIVSVRSSKVLSVKPELRNVVGEKIGLDTLGKNKYGVALYGGAYDFSAVVYPYELVGTDVVYESGDSDVLEINSVTGKARAKLSGETFVRVSCPSGIGGGVNVEIKVAVRANGTSSGLLIDGLENNEINVGADENSVEFLIEKTNLSAANIVPDGKDVSYLKNMKCTSVGGSDNRYKVTLDFVDGHPNEIDLMFALGGAVARSNLNISFSDFSFGVRTSYHLSSSEDVINHKAGTQVCYAADSNGGDARITYEWNADSDIVAIECDGNGRIAKIFAKSTGKTSLVVNAYKNGDLIATDEKTIKVIRGVSAVEFEDNTVRHGIEDVLAIPSEFLNGGAYFAYREELPVRMTYDDGVSQTYPGGDDLEFGSSDNGVITPFPTRDGFKVKVVGNGVATVTAKWRYNDYFNVDISADIKLRGVNEGCRVASESDLRKATNDRKRVVLSDNIMLGHKDMTLEELKSEVREIPTSYDWQFYKNKGLRRPAVYCAVEFKNDVFGNGFEINADNVTTAKDGAGMPLLFKGPLDFASVATASVKAQDNIVYLVRTKGVVIDNVVLKGCSDESLEENGGINLSKLNYTGTTLEIAADCKLLNSRVSNGRTVVRIFGGNVSADGNPIVESVDDVTAKDERINARIESCVLANAREFILKIGSNRAVLSTVDNENHHQQTKLSKQDGAFYEPNADNSCDRYFYDKYVITDVTLKNSVLTTSGLFSVGLETHFAGEMLAGERETGVANWVDLAATSYASALNVEGDVKFFDWKKLSNVDSSTLIETTSGAQEFLTLDISAMLDKAATTDAEYAPILSTESDGKYVHGGIAAYGGGYNYSYVNFDKCVSEPMSRYRVNLSVLAEGLEQDSGNPLYLQGTLLPKAAGSYDFNFYMYDINSENNHAFQTEALANGGAFDLTAAEVFYE